MGAWSTRIFDNDMTADILAEYKTLLGYGILPEEAYNPFLQALTTALS